MILHYTEIKSINKKEMEKILIQWRKFIYTLTWDLVLKSYDLTRHYNRSRPESGTANQKC